MDELLENSYHLEKFFEKGKNVNFSPSKVCPVFCPNPQFWTKYNTTREIGYSVSIECPIRDYPG
jgi:hypothetical protein